MAQRGSRLRLRAVGPRRPQQPALERRRRLGNQAFDDYRADTLRRLEEEEREFRDYLERLRQAKDKAEFDQFMNDRRRGRPAGSPPGETV